MRTAKFRKITETIHQMMLMNKIDAEITNSATGKMSDGYQNEKCFVYMEIRNTKPMITYVFNSDEILVIGRDISQTTVCIQDENVSRVHAGLMVKDDYLFIQNCSKTQYVTIRRRLRKICLSEGGYCPVRHTDKIYIGPVKLKFWLFKGKKWIIN